MYSLVSAETAKDQATTTCVTFSDRTILPFSRVKYASTSSCAGTIPWRRWISTAAPCWTSNARRRCAACSPVWGTPAQLAEFDRCQRSWGQGYLGCKQRLRNAVNVRIGLEPDAD